MIARSSCDGYAVMFSGGELYSSETGDETLLAYQKSGLALAAGEGPLEAPRVASAAAHVHEAQHLHLAGGAEFMARRLALERLADRFQQRPVVQRVAAQQRA